MELIRLENANNNPVYINPFYIESFLDSGDGTCHVYLNSDGESPYRTNMKADELAQLLATVNNPNVRFGPGGF